MALGWATLFGILALTHMGFKIEINSIIRTDQIPDKLSVGAEYSFKMEKSRVYFDDIPIWLVKKDWTAIAEVQIISQKRNNGSFESGKYRVLYIYTSEESKKLTKIFKRMYGWE